MLSPLNSSDKIKLYLRFRIFHGFERQFGILLHFLLSFEGKLNDTIKELIVEKLLNPRVAARGDTFCIYGKIRFQFHCHFSEKHQHLGRPDEGERRNRDCVTTGC